MELTKKKCVPCEGGEKPLKSPELHDYMIQLRNEWKLVNEKRIQYEFKFKNFKEAIKFVNKVADLAESEGHHPDIQIHWNKVLIELWTHAIGGLSENDFIVASKIEQLD